MASPEAEEGTGDFAAEGGIEGELGRDGEPFAGGEDGRKGEEVEK